MKTRQLLRKILLATTILIVGIQNNFANTTPNILFIIGDDMGVDAIDGFGVGENHPHTPNLDKLRQNGVVFTNVWATPVCAATRASIVTGKYGIHNGINTVPGILNTEHKTIFTELKEQGNVQSCVVGKWHLSGRANYDQIFKHGVDNFMGVLGAGVPDYYNWQKYEDGKVETCKTYATKYLTDYALDWIKVQEKPWLMWMAHFAPHTPFHYPPKETYTTKDASRNKGKYTAMIESLDYEIGRLLDGIPKDILENTVIVFLGDNGTPGRMLNGYPIKRGKSTLYQGGINVPLIISGKGVTRKNKKEDALINISDFYATFSQIINPKSANHIFNSYSFKHLLSNSKGIDRTYNYMEVGANNKIPNTMYTVRNEQYKFMDMGNDSFEFYDLSADPFEQNNLLTSKLNTTQQQAKKELVNIMAGIRNGNPSKKDINYPIVHTGVEEFYNSNEVIDMPEQTDALFWQDAGRTNNQPSYIDNGDGTITDNITGLMWQKDMGEKMTYAEAEKKAKNLKLGNYDDWRIPTIKELYSLILFNGKVMGDKAVTPFIDTDYFNHPIGDESKGERTIDAQTWSSTYYVGKTMHDATTIFGVNFIDGRIKGYPEYKRRTNSNKTMYFRMVRGNPDYGKNDFTDNGDGTITDNATSLMWQQTDDGKARDWETAINYCESLELAGYDDWHLPNVKELQSIVDYSRSPQTTNSAAIDPLFDVTEIKDPDGNSGHYPFYWATTTHLDGPRPYSNATYVSFGEALGKMRGKLMDVHGAGAQRSDPKTGNSSNYPSYRGPQGDALMVYNHCRCVRSTEETTTTTKKKTSKPSKKNTNIPRGNRNRNQSSAQGKKPMERMDTNKDGKISESEAQGRMKENFSQIDTNNDGFLTRSELHEFRIKRK